MASPVRALSNHYETLQVSPKATTDEIVQAFAAQMHAARMRPDITVARFAQLSVAYETLRDPSKRRTYDASIGLIQTPKVQVRPAVSPFIGAPVIDRLTRIAEPSPVPPEPRAAPPVGGPRSEPRVASFIAASLREPSKRPAGSDAAPQASAEANARPFLPSGNAQQAPRHEKAEVPPSSTVDEGTEIEDGRLSFGRTGATLAAGVIGVAILAFAVALPNRNPDRLAPRVAEGEPGLTVPVPPATAARDVTAAAQPLTATAETGAPTRILAKPARTPAIRNARPVPWVAVNDQKPAIASSDQADAQPVTAANASAPPADAPAATETPAAAAAEPAPVSTAAATLPLANATIARTIERIGYGCGRVVSAAGVEGASGVFNITCSSGDTYRASPIRGRYHFRRTTSH